MTIALSRNGCSFSKNYFDERKQVWSRNSGFGNFKDLKSIQGETPFLVHDEEDKGKLFLWGVF